LFKIGFTLGTNVRWKESLMKGLFFALFQKRWCHQGSFSKPRSHTSCVKKVHRLSWLTCWDSRGKSWHTCCPLKRHPVYTCQRGPVVCSEGDCQDRICQNTEYFSAQINRSEHHSQFLSISFTFNCKAMRGGRKSTHQGTKLGGKSWVLCRTHCKSHGNCTHDPHNQVAQDLLPTKVEQKSIDKMVKS